MAALPFSKGEVPSSFKYFKGDIAKIYGWNRPLSTEEVENIHKELPSKDLVIDYDASKSDQDILQFNTEVKQEDVHIYNSIVPHRVEGRMRCLPHDDEGIVNGKFVKGETTAANERRYVLKMQQDKIDYKSDGIKQLKYKVVGEKKLTPWAKMIDITL